MNLAQLTSDSKHLNRSRGRRLFKALAEEYTDGDLFRAFLQSLSAQTRHAVPAQVQTLPELLRNYTEQDILRWRGIGRVSAHELVQALDKIECQLGVSLTESELKLRHAYIMVQFLDQSMERAQKSWT